ncbi:MAG: hypothetical protein ACI4W6_06075, partial [Acutalibacteraceae bacterium]
MPSFFQKSLWVRATPGGQCPQILRETESNKILQFRHGGNQVKKGVKFFAKLFYKKSLWGQGAKRPWRRPQTA